MKKFIANIVLVFYVMFSFVISGMASELYYIKNADKNKVMTLAESSFKSSGYIVKNNDPLYGIKGSNDAIVIVQPVENDLYYYYDSVSDKNLNSSILKSIKNSGLKYKKYKDNTLSTSFAQEEIAFKKSISNEVKAYNFESQTIKTSKTNTTEKTINSNQAEKYNFIDNDEDALTGYVAQIPVGTTIDVYLQTSVNTASAQKGDEVTAILTKNWEYNGHIIASQGSVVTGSIKKANSAGMAYRDGVVKFSFNKITTPEGKVYNILTDDIEFKVESTGKAANAAQKIVGRAVIGALAGLVVGALAKDANLGRATAIGAASGAVWGAGSAVMEKGTDAEIPTYTEMVITLTSPLSIVISN